MILDRSRGLRRVGEWTTEIVGLHHRFLVMDEIGMISIFIVVMTAVNESGIKIGIKIGIGTGTGTGDLLPRVGHLLRLRLLLLVGRDRGRGKDLQCRIIIISQDGMRPCMRDEMKMYVVEEEVVVGIGVGREIEDTSVVAAKKVAEHPDTLYQ